MLQRLDRLTLDGARMTGAEPLEVIHRLVSDLKLVIESTQFSPRWLLIAHRAVRIDETTFKHDIRLALGMLSI